RNPGDAEAPATRSQGTATATDKDDEHDALSAPAGDEYQVATEHVCGLLADLPRPCGIVAPDLLVCRGSAARTLRRPTAPLFCPTERRHMRPALHPLRTGRALLDEMRRSSACPALVSSEPRACARPAATRTRQQGQK